MNLNNGKRVVIASRLCYKAQGRWANLLSLNNLANNVLRIVAM